MYTYRQIFKQALRIATHKPSLWFFGLFATLLGSAGELEVLLGNYGLSGNNTAFDFISGLVQGGLVSSAGWQGLKANPIFGFFLVTVFLLLLAVSVLVIWLVIVSQSALIAQAVSLSKGKSLNFKDSFKIGLMKFWPVLGINALIRVVAFSFLALSAIVTLIKFPGSTVFVLIILNLFLVLAVVVSFIFKYAICGVVLRDLKFGESIKRALKVFSKNWILSLELAVIMFLIYLFVSALLFFSLGWVLVLSLKFFKEFILGLYVVFIFLVVVFVLVQTMLAIFHWATWAVVYELLTSKQASMISFLKKFFKKVFGK